MRTFVVGVDGSEESLDALRWSLAVAGSEDRVHAVMVWTYPVLMGGGLDSGVGMAATAALPFEEFEAAAQVRLDEALGRVDAVGAELTAETVVSPSSSAGLVEAARDADLLVVGMRHQSTIDRVLIGSVAIQCAHHAPGAFIAVPASPPPLGAIVAVAVDGSESALAPLEWAAEVAAERGARLRVITAWNRAPGSGGDHAGSPYRSDEDRVVEQLRKMVEEVAPGAAASAEYLAVHAERHVASQIIEAAEGAGLLVVGSRGRGGFTGLLLGSVSQRCLESSQIPVAVIRG